MTIEERKEHLEKAWKRIAKFIKSKKGDLLPQGFKLNVCYMGDNKDLRILITGSGEVLLAITHNEGQSIDYAISDCLEEFYYSRRNIWTTSIDWNSKGVLLVELKKWNNKRLLDGRREIPYDKYEIIEYLLRNWEDSKNRLIKKLDFEHSLIDFRP